jgi:23S rRNA (pseudouridine1915-N3)-methyltransferase
MKIRLLFVGKTNLPEVESGIARYVERIRRYAPVTVRTVRAEKIGKKANEDLVRLKESERLLAAVQARSHLVVWDEHGRLMTSEAFAAFLGDLEKRAVPETCMVVGGPLGFASTVRERANDLLSLSRMTFPHDLARLLVTEQIYRAFTILKGEPYHK